MIHELWFLLPIAFVAGLIDAAVGGGGLIQLPGLLAVYPQAATTPYLLGSNKLASIMGTLSATWRYARQIELPWRILLPAAVAALCGAYLGARAVHYLPLTWIRPLIVVLLIVMLGYTLLKPDFGQTDANRPLTGRDQIIGLIIGASVGFYDGFFGPGTGSFLIFLFVRCFHFDFIRASAAAKVVNVATNLAALLYFVPVGLVLYGVALPMGIANIAGAQVGTRLAMKGGNRWVRYLFMGLAVALLAKIIFSLIQPLI